MDENISLALAVKLKSIFDREDQFLSFPLGLGYSYRSLDFMKEESDLSAQERLLYKADFARMLNFIPSDGAPVFSPSGEFLWNEIKDIVTNVTFAASTLSPAEDQQLAEAIDFLTDEQIAPDGTKTPVNSERVKAYTAHKIDYEKTEATYLDEKFSVENATGAEGQRLKNIWESGRDQELRRVKDQAMQDWINLGFKNEVEAYQTLRGGLEGKKYPILYRQAYLNEIDIAEVPDLEAQGITFCVTFFSPRDAFDRSLPWITVNLNKSEIESLIQRAPPELKGIFTGGLGNEDIESLSLEYNYVTVKRPWFRPEFFSGRYWKTSDDSVVSDGAVPRQGRLPAYINGLLTVRNVRLTKRKTSAAQDNVIPLLNTVSLQKLQLRTSVGLPHIRDASAIPRRIPQIPKPTPFVRARPATSRVPPAPSVAVTGRSTFFVSRATGGPLNMSREESRALLARERTTYVEAKYAGTTLATPRLRAPLIIASPIIQASSTIETVTQTYNLEGVAVIAFVCRRVPKAPNPDPNMQW